MLTHLTGFHGSDKTLERWQLLKADDSFQLALVQPTDLWQRRQLAALFATHQVQEFSIVR